MLRMLALTHLHISALSAMCQLDIHALGVGAARVLMPVIVHHNRNHAIAYHGVCQCAVLVWSLCVTKTHSNGVQPSPCGLCYVVPCWKHNSTRQADPAVASVKLSDT